MVATIWRAGVERGDLVTVGGGNLPERTYWVLDIKPHRPPSLPHRTPAWLALLEAHVGPVTIAGQTYESGLKEALLRRRARTLQLTLDS